MSPKAISPTSSRACPATGDVPGLSQPAGRWRRDLHLSRSEAGNAHRARQIEVANPDELLKPDMYADVVFQVEADRTPVTTVPASAIIDTGAKRQIVLVAKGEGRFEPRVVKLGRRGDGYVGSSRACGRGEDIVTTATFLIDAESNLQTALKAFTEQEPAK